jgi:cell division septal protein FtsQ
MKKKKELPRKRKRFVKRVIFFTSFVLIILLIVAGFLYYFLIFKNMKFNSVVPQQLVHSAQPTISEKNYNELVAGLQKDQIQYSAIHKGNNSFIVTLQEGGKVTFSSQKDIMTQIASLQYILSHLTMDGREFSTLDLRFDKPVIVLKP